MKIVVCVRIGLDGEINPFDASAYEAALTVCKEVTLLSMGAPKTADMLMSLTRLGAERAVLLTDPAFAGADTLATAYTLSLALKKLSPDLVFCGKQTLVGDTAQTGPMTAALLEYPIVSGAMNVGNSDGEINVRTRDTGDKKLTFPSLVTFERCYNLRFPRLGSKMREVEIWDASHIGADRTRCGLAGSPTRVVGSFENSSGRRRCSFVGIEDLKSIIAKSLNKSKQKITNIGKNDKKNGELVCIVGEKPHEYAESISDNICLIDNISPSFIEDKIRELDPCAVLFSADTRSRETAAAVAAHMSLGLCADCTSLEVLEDELIMYRPALSGSIIAKIKSLTRPALATVRTSDDDKSDIIVSVGLGAKGSLDRIRDFANSISAELCASRKMVDNGYMPYSAQVGLTGRRVCPSVFIAVGISGAIHHVSGFDRSGVVIAINSDRNASIFDYADYGIICDIDKTDF